jgi:uncharacterized membrane protein
MRCAAERGSKKMRAHATTAERLGAFSDAVIAVVITVMVLELKAPDGAAFAELAPLWPTALSYAVSYLFIAVIWVNHHHLLHFVGRTTPRLIWTNFAHLFLVSLLPFATAWMARTSFASAPVAAYAALFACVNLAYAFFERETLAQADARLVPERARRTARRRSIATVLIFGCASLVALRLPLLGFALVCSALAAYLRPEAIVGRLEHEPR